ncbi:DeoR/GlpR family DNA-binding transcription regulator [Brevibacillus massiliensis]|jgi:DeoR/GlpR family transcriptional regulator of sugar metabolism|uniref:DeoR/GlpR family DNA-binding transcription regulator n=1 Tax=Brevibacillus massiliensis TaxID=1118054 RepID=UPI0002DE5571|nr:DeoR/GlpR family DNA-binding transcription regulator [Brevibacillus massiliensis]
MANDINARVETRLASDRHRAIIDLLEERGTLRVADLSKRFQVTEETIRRDLERLEGEGALLRVHGGAVRNRKEGLEIPALQREALNREEKRAIGVTAASLVEDGEIIALDASTTCLQLAKHLPDLHLTVLTNSIAVVLELASRENVNVILAGGYFRRESLSLLGVPTENMIEGYHVDKYFFSCHGFDLRRGVSEADELQAQVKKRFISISEQLILLADSSKYNRKSLVRLTGLEKVDKLVTDNKLPVNCIKEVKQKGVNILVAE